MVFDDQRNLVVAAAGSGKTSVIVAKAGWLIERGLRHPSEILVLAFARTARAEMRERIRRRLGPTRSRQINAHTFHSLGLSIMARAEGKRPSLADTAKSDRAFRELLKSIVADLLFDDEHSAKVLQWFREWFAPYRSRHDFANRGEYGRYLAQHNIRTLKGEKAGSYEHCVIANFLLLGGIAYDYGGPYEQDIETPDGRPYQPDFFLSDHGVYIEHFDMDAEGMPPPFIDAERFRQGMEWKRRVHADHGTSLIETYSCQHPDGSLLRNLSKELDARGVVLSPLPRESVLALLQARGRIDSFSRLLATFLRHFKGAGLSFDEISRRAAKHEDRGRAEAFLTVFQPVFERYEKSLADSDTVDFEDIIRRATDLVESGRYRNRFGYILVDEFQDIFPACARLLKALLDNSRGSQLFAVGDDWQSINRFAGSDLGIMREFGRHFGKHTRIDLETMFRTSERIATVATDFVLRNPAQIRKAIRPMRRADGPAVHICVRGQETRLLSETLDRIARDARCHQGKSAVLLLGRYNHLEPPDLDRLASRHPRLRLAFSTIHRSKGLEADYVVILGVTGGRLGFPSNVADDPLLGLVLSAPEEYPHAEERRLMYVAMTRARRQVYLLADGDPRSSFVIELIDGDYDVSVFGQSPEPGVYCPRCKAGRLEQRENRRDQSKFYGCTNVPHCTYVARPCPNCGSGLPVKAGDAHRCGSCEHALDTCPVCDSWLLIRKGRHGRFQGCSTWPECEYTRGLRPS